MKTSNWKLSHAIWRLMYWINPLEIQPDLASWTNEGVDDSHLDNGRCKVVKEGCLVFIVVVHYRISFASTEELLIRVEKPYVLDKVFVVAVVKHYWSLSIKWSQVGVS